MYDVSGLNVLCIGLPILTLTMNQLTACLFFACLNIKGCTICETVSNTINATENMEQANEASAWQYDGNKLNRTSMRWGRREQCPESTQRRRETAVPDRCRTF